MDTWSLLLPAKAEQHTQRRSLAALSRSDRCMSRGLPHLWACSNWNGCRSLGLMLSQGLRLRDSADPEVACEALASGLEAQHALQHQHLWPRVVHHNEWKSDSSGAGPVLSDALRALVYV